MVETHSEDLRNVSENDIVTLEMSTGERFSQVECEMYQVQNADPRSGEVRETKLWAFALPNGDSLTASITNGLRSSPNDPEFPQHKSASIGQIGERDGWTDAGYIDDVSIVEA